MDSPMALPDHLPHSVETVGHSTQATSRPKPKQQPADQRLKLASDNVDEDDDQIPPRRGKKTQNQSVSLFLPFLTTLATNCPRD